MEEKTDEQTRRILKKNMLGEQEKGKLKEDLKRRFERWRKKGEKEKVYEKNWMVEMGMKQADVKRRQ